VTSSLGLALTLDDAPNIYYEQAKATVTAWLNLEVTKLVSGSMPRLVSKGTRNKLCPTKPSRQMCVVAHGAELIED
jgi:hypothetical protein